MCLTQLKLFSKPYSQNGMYSHKEIGSRQVQLAGPRAKSNDPNIVAKFERILSIVQRAGQLWCLSSGCEQEPLQVGLLDFCAVWRIAQISQCVKLTQYMVKERDRIA